MSTKKSFFEQDDDEPASVAQEQAIPLDEQLAHTVLEDLPAPGKDRQDIAQLQGYEKLITPLPLAHLTVEGVDWIEQVLRREFPWFDAVIQIIRQQALMNVGLTASVDGEPKGVVRFRPLLLVGPPGTGKTRFVRRLAELMGVPSLILAVGGSSDNRLIAGTARGWGTGRPSELLRIIKSSGIANPIICLDEMDKEGSGSHNGKLSDTLHQLLEVENARRWYDQYLLVNCDLSALNWIGTANRADHLEQSLLSRFQVLEVPMPKGDELISVVHGTRSDLAREYRVPLDYLPMLEGEEWAFLLDRFHRGGVSPRGVGRLVRGLLEMRMSGNRQDVRLQ